MITYTLKIELLSDTTFGRGDGVAGLIDQEVEHDSSGFPYLRGRTLKGLLSEECDNLVAVLSPHHQADWQEVACLLFGYPGSSLDTLAKMHVGDACLPTYLRNAVARQLQRDPQLTPADILTSLTTIRRQTAMDSELGTPKKRSLRSSRVVVRELCFTAPFVFQNQPTEKMLALLAAGTLALRRVGSGRNRGRGRVQCTLLNLDKQDISKQYLQYFAEETKA